MSRPNELFTVENLAATFPALDAIAICRVIRGKKCYGGSAAFVPFLSPDKKRIIGVVYGPIRENEAYADAYYDFLIWKKENMVGEKNAEVDRLLSEFKSYGRPLGLAHNPNGADRLAAANAH